MSLMLAPRAPVPTASGRQAQHRRTAKTARRSQLPRRAASSGPQLACCRRCSGKCTVTAVPLLGSLAISIYDPNHPLDDTIELRVELDADGRVSRLDQSSGEPLLAFFRAPYSPKPPTA